MEELATISVYITDEDIRLIDGCLQNVRSVQKELYYKYCNAMFTLAYRILKDEDEANDVIQDVFIQVFKKIKQFRRESSLGAWIKRIVIRTAMKRVSMQERYVPFEENLHDKKVYLNTNIDGKFIEKIILDLPTGFRTVFILAEIEGYKHKEIAEILNISEGTSKSQLYYAKKMLKERLQHIEF